VNLTGPFLMCREFGKEMLEQGKGSIATASLVVGAPRCRDRAAWPTLASTA